MGIPPGISQGVDKLSHCFTKVIHIKNLQKKIRFVKLDPTLESQKVDSRPIIPFESDTMLLSVDVLVSGGLETVILASNTSWERYWNKEHAHLSPDNER